MWCVEPGFVQTLAFAPDNETVVTSGSAGAVNFWSVPDLGREGEPLLIGNGANNGGTFASYAPHR